MGGVRVAAATFCLVLPGLVSADRRGEVVCGVPPDEAVGYTIEKSYGGWEWWGLRPRYPHRLHDTEREALDEHAPEAIYVCDIEVMDNFKTFPARFYRLDRPLLKSETNVRGEMTEGENDARRWILGGEPNERPPPPSSSGAARSQIEHTPECLGGIEWHDEHGILFLRITNTCSYEAFVRTCWGAWATQGPPVFRSTWRRWPHASMSFSIPAQKYSSKWTMAPTSYGGMAGSTIGRGAPRGPMPRRRIIRATSSLEPTLSRHRIVETSNPCSSPAGTCGVTGRGWCRWAWLLQLGRAGCSGIRVARVANVTTPRLHPCGASDSHLRRA